MRCLARLQPKRNLEWLRKSVTEAPYRREPWLELAEHYDSKSDWINLFWACANGLEKTRRIGSRLDNPGAWGFRLHDLMAVACSHLGLIPRAIKHGTIALTFLPTDKRLANNLAYYHRQWAEQRSSGDTAQQSKEVDSAEEKLREAEKSEERYAEASDRPASGKRTGKYAVSTWAPERAQGGTELMVEELKRRLNGKLDLIDLKINLFNSGQLTSKPLVLWMHHNVDQQAVQWCRDTSLVSLVETFVFVSEWQLKKYIEAFGLARDKCVVLRNATSINQPLRRWTPGDNCRRVAYVSTPFRGLDVLLGAWDHLRPKHAELHIWSSMKLYGQHHNDQSYASLFQRGAEIPNVFYRGIVPNDEQLKSELCNVEYLAYPSTFEETSCLSVIESLVSGCRVICPTIGALPETCGQFARLYHFQTNREVHASMLSHILEEELANPWGGDLELAEAQQRWARDKYDWAVRAPEWEAFVRDISRIGQR